MQLAYLAYLKQNWGDELKDCRQGFTRISLIWKSAAAQNHFSESLTSLELIFLPLSGKVWEIPVCYEPEFGSDLSSLAGEKKMTAAALINLHTQPYYRIHFFGFLPGFFYLNGLDPILHTPRKSIPSARVPKCSVAIGGSQTGIYPKESPGGWHLLGQTPLSLFDSLQEPPVWGSAGDQIKFVSIDSTQFRDWKGIQPCLQYP